MLTECYVGEIRLFAGNYAPQGWMFCEGQLLEISENESLFYLIGTTYGGDGEWTFALPDLRGRVPIHEGNGYILAEGGGDETVTLLVSQIPAHSHSLIGTSAVAWEETPGGRLLAESRTTDLYSTQSPATSLGPASIGAFGGSASHENMMPYIAVHYIIALSGVFPSA